MRKVLYIVNDCMRKFTYERITGLQRAIRASREPVNLYIVRSDGYSEFAPEHNRGEYNIFRLPDYGEYDGIFLDINSIFDGDSDSYTRGVQYAILAAAASGKPVISMANDIEGFHYVGIDNYAAMQSVIRYLHRELDRTDFWFAMGPSDNYENRERTRGLVDYCAENGLPHEADRFYAESFIIESGMHAFEELLRRHGGRPPQAILCANDHIALGVCHAAETAGFRIPRDFMVTGFDNIDVASYLSPSITSVDQQCWEMGEACMDAMRRIWAGETLPHRICIPTELVLRETTGHAAYDGRALRNQISEYIGQTASVTDFNYRLSAMQYQLPACRTIEEIGEALVRCLSVLNCKGVSLVLDSGLFEHERIIEFTDDIGHMRDAADGMSVDGYSDRMTRVFCWQAGKGACLDRQAAGEKLSSECCPGPGENHLFAPLHFMEHTVGYLCIWDCIDLMRVKGVSAVVNTLTMALRNFFARRNLSYVNQVLSGISMKDELTGLYNRLGYHELAYPLYHEVVGRGGRLAVVFVDMDRLKTINDTFGHATGDLAIRAAASSIRDCVPQSALPVRYGGDEFLVLTPARDERDVDRLIGRITDALAQRILEASIPDMFGLSFGYVLTDPEGTEPLDECVVRADARMYAEKKRKRAQRR